MLAIPSTLTSVLMLILPWPLILVSVGMGAGADRHARLMKRMVLGAAWFALTCAVLAAVTDALGWTASKTYGSVPLPARLGLLAINVEVNKLSVLMLVLVALVGMIVARYSYSYLAGDVHEGRFHRWLSFTLGVFLIMVTSGNIWEFLVAWVVTSLGLHKLLAFYGDRPVAVLAARKKYLLHRIADGSLLAAFALIARVLHTAMFAGIAPALAGIHAAVPVSLQIAGGLLVVSAVLKSAQFPFHGWLIQVMEAPTPVSALLHAGIIYTGAFLLLRTVPMISRVGWTGDALILVGLGSIAVASLMMMTASNIKGSLAYSTCGQMGFVLMECGMGLYSLALLHIVSHSVYKAHAFLGSGSVVEPFRGPQLPSIAHAPTPWKTIGSLVIAASVVVAMAWVFRVPVYQQPAFVVMGIILTVAIALLLSQALHKPRRGERGYLWVIAAISVLVAAAFFGLDAAVSALFGGVLPPGSGAGGVFYDGLLVLVTVVFVGLLFIQQMLPQLWRYPLWQAVYVHLYNDLYIDMLFTRWVQRYGPRLGAESSPDAHGDSLRKVLP